MYGQLCNHKVKTIIIIDKVLSIKFAEPIFTFRFSTLTGDLWLVLEVTATVGM